MRVDRAAARSVLKGKSFVMANGVEAELVQFVEACCAAAEDLSEAVALIRESYPAEQSAHMDLVCAAFSYHRRWPEAQTQAVFGPAWEFYGAGSYPKPLDTLSEQDLDILERFSAGIAAPLGASRLHHLLWERRHGRPQEHAQHAIDNYVSLCRRNSERMECVGDLAYAQDLALRIGDLVRLERVEDLGRFLARRYLENPNEHPGLVLGVLGVLAVLPASRRPLDLPELLAAAEQGLADPHLREEALQLMITAGGDAQSKRDIAERIVDLWVEAAREEKRPLVAAAHLEHAREQARAFGLTSRAKEILAHLGEVPIMDDMQIVTSSVSISKNEYEAWLNHFLGRPTWQECLAVFGNYEPVGQRRLQTVESVKQTMNDFPLQFMVQKQIVDSHGAPIAIVRTSEEHFRAALAQQETLATQLWSHSAADILDRSVTDEVFSESGIQLFFESPLIPDPAARSFVLSMNHFRNGDFESALMVALPAIEACLRVWARALGIALLEPGPFGVTRWRGIGSLIQDLEPRVPGGFMKYLYVLLADPMALNLRNRAMHGLLEEVSKQEAALALHVACALTRWQVGPVTSVDQ